MNLYYEIWVDVIVKLRSIPKNVGMWKFYSMAFISMAMALNLIVLLLIFHDLGLMETIKKIPINIFPGTKIDAFVSFFVSYLLPMLLINYFLIFYKKRYEKLMLIYKPQDGKLFVRYFLGSLLVLILYFFIAFLFVRVIKF